MEQPTLVTVQFDPNEVFVTLAPEGDRGFRGHGVAVTLTPATSHDGIVVSIESAAPISRVQLHWSGSFARDTVVLGDAVERSYGELGWGPIGVRPFLPWYALAHEPATGRTAAFGVATGPSAFAWWRIAPNGATLNLDVRNGGRPVELGTRRLEAATVVAFESEDDPWLVLGALLDRLHLEPVRSPGPLVGSNNWYYAYGKGFGPESVLGDARTIVEYADGHPVRPFCVIDDGWNVGGAEGGGPWDAGTPGLFDDLPGLAAEIHGLGARPGIWYRPLLTERDGAGMRDVASAYRGRTLDPSHPAVLDLVEDDLARFAAWGFDLVKHDFSTFDVLGTFDPDANSVSAWDAGFADRSRTTAEIVTGFYQRLRDAAPDTLILGCNTIGHLAAGLVDAQRTGDDTSGREWDRTRRMGVNTLAFRLPQHGRFFAVDADCVPNTPLTPWARNREFLDLVARSGTALFVSVDPVSRTDASDADLAAAVQLALSGGEPGGIRPLDWMTTRTPTEWAGIDRTVAYDWNG